MTTFSIPTKHEIGTSGDESIFEDVQVEIFLCEECAYYPECDFYETLPMCEIHEEICANSKEDNQNLQDIDQR